MWGQLSNMTTGVLDELVELGIKTSIWGVRVYHDLSVGQLTPSTKFEPFCHVGEAFWYARDKGSRENLYHEVWENFH